MAAPQKAREGYPATLNGVAVAAGLWHQERAYTARATTEELWAPLDIAAGPRGRKALWESSSLTTGKPDESVLARFSAYLSQARTFYVAAEGMDLRSRPLAAYYSLLNLAKAWLTLADPSLTARKALHGASDQFSLGPHQHYTFSKEVFAIHANGVLPEVSRRSGRRFAYATTSTFKLADFLPYLCEAYGELEESDATPRLLPLSSVTVWKGKADQAGKPNWALWLRAEVDRGALSARGLGASSLGDRAKHFGDVLKHRQTPEETYSYESDPVFYGRNSTHALSGIRDQFQNAFIYTNRGSGAHRHFAVLTGEDRLSQEAVTFSVMNHLSNMVRYRPEQVDRLAASKHSWLLSTWTSRALENALLTYSSRILDREVRIE